MLSCSIHRDELHKRLSSVNAILDASHPATDGIDISREARGISIVLIYAAYENLLYGLCRSLLEVAVQLRVSNRSLRPGLQVFAAFGKLQAIASINPARIWSGAGHDVIATVTRSDECTISPDLFPTDGSHMRQSQVVTFCKVFDLGHPAPVLQEVWERLDTIVSERNAIAHGRQTPDEVGRNYTIAEVTKEYGSSWIFEPCLTCANTLRRVQCSAFSLVGRWWISGSSGGRSS
jgi:hypothetical protein